jgi:hypothetical protein
MQPPWVQGCFETGEYELDVMVREWTNHQLPKAFE